MFTSITIKNYRCFDQFSIEPLEQVNLIAGKNGVGKTALLEAIYLLLGVGNAALIARVSAFRGIEKFKAELSSIQRLMWTPLFPEFDVESIVEVSGKIGDGRYHRMELRLVPTESARLALDDESAQEPELSSDSLISRTIEIGHTTPDGESRQTRMVIDPEEGLSIKPAPKSPSFPGFFLSAHRRRTPQEDAEQFGNLEMMKESYNLIGALRKIEPRLERVRTIFTGDTPLLYGDVGLGQMLPLNHMGDGLSRLTSLLLTIANASGGVVLVDEIENGFHYSVLRDVWEAIGEAARRFDTQVFATTHSYECIRAAHEAFEAGDEYDFRLHRLERADTRIKSVTYDRDSLTSALKHRLEVR